MSASATTLPNLYELEFLRVKPAVNSKPIKVDGAGSVCVRMLRIIIVEHDLKENIPSGRVQHRAVVRHRSTDKATQRRRQGHEEVGIRGLLLLVVVVVGHDENPIL